MLGLVLDFGRLGSWLSCGRAGLWGVYRPRFGLAVPAPTSLSTQPPFAMQALIEGQMPEFRSFGPTFDKLKTLIKSSAILRNLCLLIFFSSTLGTISSICNKDANLGVFSRYTVSRRHLYLQPIFLLTFLLGLSTPDLFSLQLFFFDHLSTAPGKKECT